MTRTRTDGGEMPAWLTQADLARHWRLSGRTLARWRAEGYGPPWVVLGGSVRYRREDVLAFEAAHRRGPQSTGNLNRSDRTGDGT